MDYDQAEELAELAPEAVLELARAQGLTRARGAHLPRPAGLPAGGWYQTRQLRTGGRALIYRYPTNQTDARPHEPCPCGSGKLFGRCCMTTANKTIGRLN
jgi:hypothetical protein